MGRRWRCDPIVPAGGGDGIRTDFSDARGVFPRLEVAAAGVYPDWSNGDFDLCVLRCLQHQPEHGQHSHGAVDLGTGGRYGYSHCAPPHPSKRRRGRHGSSHSKGCADQWLDHGRNLLFSQFEPPPRSGVHRHLAVNCHQRAPRHQFGVDANIAPLVCGGSGRVLVDCQSARSFV